VVCATAVELPDLLVSRVVEEGLLVEEGVVGQLMLLALGVVQLVQLDFLVLMIGLVQCKT